jgi:hypothetical protein
VYDRDRSYVVTSGIVLVMAGYFTAKQRWGIGFDVWEHAAAVRELMHHPFSPTHPTLPVDAPHQLFTPYHLVVALVGRVFSLDIVTAMSLAGIANVVLVLVALRLFVNRLCPRSGVATLTLLFTLFLWGRDPWAFSGFLNARALWSVLAYPATFAMGATLLALALFMRFQDDADPRFLPLISVVGAVVALSHQVEAALLYGLAGAFVLTRDAIVPWRRQVAALVASGAGTVVIALAWPYFSLWDLTFGHANAAFRAGISHENLPMYTDVPSRIWLSLLGVPFVMFRVARNPRDPIFAGLVVAVLLYVFGWRTGQHLMGRSMATAVLFLHVALADATVEAAAAARRVGDAARSARRWIAVMTAAAVLFGANLIRQPALQAVPFAMALPDWVVHDDSSLLVLRAYRFLPHFVHRGDVVLAEGSTSFIVPAMSDARVVAVPRPLAFVDTSARDDIARFFDPAATTADRRAIIARDRVTFVLVYIPVEGMTATLLDQLLQLGQVVHRDPVYALVDVRRPAA